jgi:HPt (histidine-containing phosphotransfer) domain-containing protein
MDAIIDIDEAKKRLDGDVEILRELLEIFADELPRMMADIEAAITRDDARALQHSAHSLKGSAANLSAKSVTEAARVLELAGRDGNLNGVRIHYATLAVEVARLRVALEDPAIAA